MRESRWKPYQVMWFWLLIGWVVSYADRAVNGPIITWMIQHKVSFLFSAAHPYALGGLIGGVFFTGYMLTQFPGGYFGDRFGHRRIITLSLLWAGLITIVSGFLASLFAFVLLRVLVGLGEGMYYANDRTLITEVTPYEKRSLGMGVVISGLSIGLTLALVFSPFLINWGEAWFGTNEGWRMPFFVLGLATLIVGALVNNYFKQTHPKQQPYRVVLAGVSRYVIPFLIAIMAVFVIADRAGLPNWGVAAIEVVLALALIGFTYMNKGQELASTLRSRDLMLIFISFIAVIWNLWFFNFWSVSIISDAAHTSFLAAALTAAFNGVAGVIGYPVGGWLADYAVRKNWGRKMFYLLFTFLQGVFTVIFAVYLGIGGKSAVVMGCLLFIASLFFNALQPVSHAMVSELAEDDQRGSAFGLFNLISEIGAVLSPVISGTLRDATGSWNSAVYLDAVLIFVSFLLIVFVRERRKVQLTTGAAL
jgi:ACS family D-galactonate transporter-like MFS transporter